MFEGVEAIVTTRTVSLSAPNRLIKRRARRLARYVSCPAVSIERLADFLGNPFEERFERPSGSLRAGSATHSGVHFFASS